MYLNVNGFAKEGVELLCDWLKNKWCLECHPKNRKGQWQIAFSWYGRNEFFDLIRKHIIPSMTYKIRLKKRIRYILDKDKVMEARLLRSSGKSYSEIGKKFNMTGTGIRRAVLGITWKHVP